MNKNRTAIRNIVAQIVALDASEQTVITQSLDWIDTDAPLERQALPDVPVRHLVSYFVLFDHDRRSVLLMKHIRAGLWLPTGGHVQVGETPREAAMRELAEELGPRAQMVSTIASMPLFISAGVTREAKPHTDVSLWYVVAADENMWLEPDPGEFSGYSWMKLDEVLEMDIEELDPNMHRFIHKLKSAMD